MLCSSSLFNLFGFNAPKFVGAPNSLVALVGRSGTALRMQLIIWRTEPVLPPFRNASLAGIASRSQNREFALGIFNILREEFS